MKNCLLKSLISTSLSLRYFCVIFKHCVVTIKIIQTHVSGEKIQKELNSEWLSI